MTMHTTRRRLAAALASTLAVTLVLAACAPTADAPAGEPADASASPSVAQTEPAILAGQGLAGADARTIIDTLDALPVAERPEDVFVSIRPDQLVVSDSTGREETVPMPEDEFYVSLAPYVDQTHDCYYHSLTTCTGELGDQEIHVTVTDTATGEVIVDEDLVTFDNGFVGVWLPRGIDAELTVAYQDLSATAPLSTSAADDATCVTTMQLT